MRWLAAARDALTSVLLPADCRICSKVLLHSLRVPICQDCLDSFHSMPERICMVCSQPKETWTTQLDEADLCPACQVGTFAFERLRSLAIYEDAVVRAILMLKFERIEPLGRWFGGQLAELVRGQGGLLDADIVVPVPLHRDRERSRGYNQAQLISQPLAKQLRLPHRPILLMRTKPRPAKQILTTRERWDAVRGAFATRRGTQVDNLRVLLVDDVVTTGATLDSCARALLEAGAKSVVGVAVARAMRSPLPVARES